MSFNFKFKPEDLKILLNNNIEYENWYREMYHILPNWNINTVERVSGFIAQTGHESSDYRITSENLNYSVNGLLKVFGKYFGPGKLNPTLYARKPEKIANVVYGNRMGNGPESSGDGWKYRGRGIIQITGYYNYKKFADSQNMSVDQAIDYIQTKQGALASACWFWSINNLNQSCDERNIVRMSKIVNGGTNGLQDRVNRFNRALNVFAGIVPVHTRIAKLGSKGDLVKKIQRVLNINDDGIFGSQTATALKNWQLKNGLVPDGIAGPETLKIMKI